MFARGLLVPLAVLFAAYVAYEIQRPDLLLVGNITVDLVDGTTPTGGAVSYAAVVAKALKLKSCVVTVAGPEADLGVFEGSRLYVLPAKETLTFEHTYTWWGHSRKLRVTANPNITVSRANVPRWCRSARAVLLGPLTLHDLDAASFLQFDGFWDRMLRSRQLVGLMGQGFQRRLGPGGTVLPLTSPSEQLLAGLGPQVSVFLSDVETDAWRGGALQAVADASQRLLVTRGEKGALELRPGGEQLEVPATPIGGPAVDTNGAGDTFATAYMVAMLRRDPNPGATASWAASRAVLRPQVCKPRCAPDLIPAGWPPISPIERLLFALTPLLSAPCTALVGALHLGPQLLPSCNLYGLAVASGAAGGQPAGGGAAAAAAVAAGQQK